MCVYVCVCVAFLNYLTVYVVIVLFLSEPSRQIEETCNLKAFVFHGEASVTNKR